MISIFNSISFVILLLAISILIIRSIKTRDYSFLIMAFALGLLLFVSITNLLEHLFSIKDFDLWEDMLEIIFLPALILSVHIKILQSELRKRLISERKFKAIFDNSFSLMGLLNRNGKLLEANDTALSFGDATFDSFVEQNFEDGVWWAHSELEKNKFREGFKEALKGKTIRFETTHYNNKNELQYIDFTLKPIFNSQNEVEYVIPEGRNITDLKLAQIDLEIHKEHLEDLVTEKTNELDIALQEAKKLNDDLQVTNEELKTNNETLKEQREYLEKTLEQLKNTQLQLVESEKMAALGTLTAGVAHEINNPLNFILGGITGIENLVNECNVSSNADYKTLINAIYTGINRISTIVKSLGKYSRTDEGNWTSCDVNKIIDDCLIILHNQYKNTIQIEKNYTENSFASGNEGRYHQVFLNLIHNAVQSIESKGKITISTEELDNELIVTVSDTGMGIKKENLKQVFDPFFTTKDPDKGTGLGLYISKKIITDYKGKISIKSKVNEGTQVIVSLLKSQEKN